MRVKTNVATPSSTRMVSSTRRMRYLCIEMKALHQFRKTLTAQTQRGSRVTAMAGCAGERRANVSFLELDPRALQRFVRRQLRGSRDGRRKRRRADHSARRHGDDERRQHVLQLSNVPRPIIPRQRANSVLTEHRFATDSLCSFLPEPRGQQWNIFDAFAKRRHIDADDVEAIQQVL